MRQYWSSAGRLLDIKISTLAFTEITIVLLFFHELSYILQVKLPELISIHRHIHIQLFDLR